MAEFVTDCPRCGASKITFNALHSYLLGKKNGWQYWFDVFSVCRHCLKTVVFQFSQKDRSQEDFIKSGPENMHHGSLNHYFAIEGFASLKDFTRKKPPEHLPDDIKAAFEEGATCMAVGCINAGATMFRLCIDHATKALLPEKDINGLNAKIRWSLGLRLKWLFDNNALPEALRELSHCVKEDGNDGAHEGSLTPSESEDLLDFTCVLLERLYTEPERLRLANERREKRRSAPSK